VVAFTTSPCRAAVRLNSGVRAHMRKFFAALTFASLSACATTSFPASPVGCYSAGDATTYVHFYLQLSSEGTFRARLKNHMADYQTTNGHWSETGNKIVLHASEPNDALTSTSTALTRNRGGTLTLPKGSVSFSGWSPLTPSSCEP
jgi:hypothetical protein